MSSLVANNLARISMRYWMIVCSPILWIKIFPFALCSIMSCICIGFCTVPAWSTLDSELHHYNQRVKSQGNWYTQSAHFQLKTFFAGSGSWLLKVNIIQEMFFKGTASETNRMFHWLLAKWPLMSVTNKLLHGKLPMQMYALEAQSGTNGHREY